MSSALQNWLKNVGLSQLAEIFSANDIDLEVLPHLSDTDLKELGLSLGHRRKLQQAVAARPPQPLRADGELATASADDDAVEHAAHEAERRQLTVLFCDLVGSTALSRRLDPEELRDLIRHYQNAVSAIVGKHGGYVANFVGDGIVAYFGWPRADEDDAAQAIRAGLAVIAAVRQFPVRNGQPLRARVGIASGLVVVGDLDTAGRRQAGAIAGDAPNLAARLQALADADQVVIDSLTQQLIGAGFILEELGPQTLKGFSEPTLAWRVVAERVTESRFESRKGGHTPFIGREQEMALLIERFERAAAGEAQAVLLSGEPGIGKSRLVQTLCERLEATQHTRIRLQCSPFHTMSTLHPVLRHLERAAGFVPDDDAEMRLSKLDRLLREAVDDPTQTLAALAPLLSLPVSDRQMALELSSEQREKLALNAVVDQLLGLAARKPVLLILEDAQWIDPATRELMSLSLARMVEARVLLVTTHRPEFQSDWARHPQVTMLTLNRLSRGQGAEIARGTAVAALSEEIVAGILRRADGVPLFIEELARSVVEIGTGSGDVIPETLQATLLARLDRLGADVKEIAQIASVIGRDFTTDLISAVTGKSKAALTPSIDRLVASQIALSTGSAEGDAYTFRHALLQDAAYQSLLLSRRRQYHCEVARTLESAFPRLTENQPELVAPHYTAAAMPEQAIPYWVKAGERALARSAFREPMAHFEQAVRLARDLPQDNSKRPALILGSLLLLGEAHHRVFHLADASAAFTEAAELARTHGSPADLARAAVGLEGCELGMDVPVRVSAGLLEAALSTLDEGEIPLRCGVLSHLGRALFKEGAYERGSAMMRQATDLARKSGDRGALSDALQCAHIATAGCAWSASHFAMRRETLEEMLTTAEEVGDHPELTARAYFYSAHSFLEMGDLAAFEQRLTRAREVVERFLAVGQYGYSLASAHAMQAILYGDFAEAERFAEHALKGGSEIHDEVAVGVYGVQMFTIRREQGRLAEVAPVIRRFLAENPQDSAWRPGLALIASDLGFGQAAQKALAEMSANGFAFPVDAKRNLTLCYLAEVCSRLEDADRAEQLYKLLSPYRDLAVVVPVATVCCGAIARYLGMLAAVLGNWETAEAHFEAALEMDERLHAWPWLAHTKHEFALMLQARGRPGDGARAETLLAEASASAERFGMAALQTKIRSLVH